MWGGGGGKGAIYVHVDGGCTFTLWHPELNNYALEKHALNKVVACLMYKHVELYPFLLFIYRLLTTLLLSGYVFMNQR